MNYLNDIDFEARLNWVLSSPNNATNRNQAHQTVAMWEAILRNPGFRFNKSSPNFRRIQNKVTEIMRTKIASTPRRKN